MDYEIEIFLPDEKELLAKRGLNENGRMQRVIDTSFIHYMRLKMQSQSGMMIAQTKNPKGGLVTVESPYAHYMNEGIKYVDPKTKKGAFHDPISGRFWSRPRVKKIPSTDLLNYSDGPERGSHFVQRTISENFDDIVREAQKEIGRT